jgi:hypothetical protein
LIVEKRQMGLLFKDVTFSLAGPGDTPRVVDGAGGQRLLRPLA